MPSPIHEIAVARLGQDPALLPALARKLLGGPPPAALPPIDSTVRLANPEEVRPDLILAQGARGPWNVIEIQRRVDREKAVRWPLLVSVLHAQRGCAGDLWVLTASRRTASWARRACDARGPGGTRSRLTPIVLLLGPEQIEALLDEQQPSLAFFAAWAMQHRHGRAAVRVIERALAITRRLPKSLQEEQGRDILNVLDRRLRELLQEKSMFDRATYEGPVLKELRRQFEAGARVETKREGVRMVLAARGLPLSSAQKAEIVGCSDIATLDRWLVAAAKAESVDEVLAPPPARRKRAAPAARAAARPRAARSA